MLYARQRVACVNEGGDSSDFTICLEQGDQAPLKSLSLTMFPTGSLLDSAGCSAPNLRGPQ